MELKNYFSQQLTGQVIANPQVFVYLPNSQTLAGGLQTANGNTLSNPFVGTSTGLIQFSAPDGRYDLRVVGEGRDFRIPIQCLDVTSATTAQAQAAAAATSAMTAQTANAAAQAQATNASNSAAAALASANTAAATVSAAEAEANAMIETATELVAEANSAVAAEQSAQNQAGTSANTSTSAANSATLAANAAQVSANAAVSSANSAASSATSAGSAATSASSASTSATNSATAASNSAAANVSATSAASAATCASSAATSAASASNRASTSASQANAVLTAASTLRASQNSTTTNGSGGVTTDLTLVGLGIPSNYPILGDSFSIEAFGLQQQANGTNAITVEIVNASGTVLASTSIQAGGTTQIAPGRGWHVRGFVHLRTYNSSTQVANVACGLDITVSGLPTASTSSTTDNTSISQLYLRIRSSQTSASQIITGLIATITEVRPFFTGTLG